MKLAVFERQIVGAGVDEQRGSEIAALEPGFFQCGVREVYWFTFVALRESFAVYEFCFRQICVAEICACKGAVFELGNRELRISEVGIGQILVVKYFGHWATLVVMVDSLLEDKRGKTSATRMSGRLTRSVLLGSVAVAFAIYWLAESYGVDTSELLEYLKTSVVFVLFFALFGVLAGMLIWLIRSSRRR